MQKNSRIKKDLNKAIQDLTEETVDIDKVLVTNALPKGKGKKRKQQNKQINTQIQILCLDQVSKN